VAAQPLTKEQLASEFRRYLEFGRLRERRLVVWFLLFVGAVFAMLGIIGIAKPYIPRSIVELSAMVVLAAFVVAVIGLAIYIVLTARPFRRKYGLHCESCGAEVRLLAPGERLEQVMIRTPFVVHCHKCNATIAR
jgi:hypothetical protein